jgi:hypothetical protein
MNSNTKWRILAVVLTTGLAVSAQASIQPQSMSQRQAAMAQVTLASSYGTSEMGPCPQGAPYGGPKCGKLIPPTGSHSSGT